MALNTIFFPFFYYLFLEYDCIGDLIFYERINERPPGNQWRC